MPLTYKAPTGTVSMLFDDFNEQDHTESWHLIGADEAARKASFDAVANAYNTLTGMKAVARRINSYEEVDTGANTPAFGHQREHFGVVKVYTTESTLKKPKTKDITFHAPVVGLLATDKRFLNQANADLLTYLKLFMSAGGVGNGPKACLGYESDGTTPIYIGTVTGTALDPATATATSFIKSAFVRHMNSKKEVLTKAEKLRIG